jgi:hypothetical protein
MSEDRAAVERELDQIEETIDLALPFDPQLSLRIDDLLAALAELES